MRPPKRKSDWESRLSAFIASIRRKPHSYGEHDCLVGLAAGAVKAMTGRDYGRGHRRKYKSQASALRHLQSLGHSSFESYLDSLFAEKPLGFAQRGDIVLVRDDTGQDIPGISLGEHAVIIGTDGKSEGLQRVSRDRWLKAWAV